MNLLNCGDFLLYTPVNPFSEFLGYWVVRENGGGGEGGRGKERACVYVGMYVCMYVYTYVYIAKASRNLYCAEYLRLITVCYVSSI